MFEPTSVPSRRDILRSVPAISALALAAPMLAGCSPQPVEAPPVRAGRPRIPEDSTDFDTLNTLLQLEMREVALAGEVIAGDRLDPAPARLAGDIRSHHLAHIDSLRRLIEDAGGQSGEVRERYVLPTPLGDQRRALTTLLENESNLAAAYKSAVSELKTARLAPVLASNLFSESTHVAALKVVLDLDRSIVAFA